MAYRVRKSHIPKPGSGTYKPGDLIDDAIFTVEEIARYVELGILRRIGALAPLDKSLELYVAPVEEDPRNALELSLLAGLQASDIDTEEQTATLEGVTGISIDGGISYISVADVDLVVCWSGDAEGDTLGETLAKLKAANDEEQLGEGVDDGDNGGAGDGQEPAAGASTDPANVGLDKEGGNANQESGASGTIAEAAPDYSTLTVDQLKQIAQAAGIERPPAKREALIALIKDLQQGS